MNGRRIGFAVALAACVIGGLTGGVATGGEKTRTKVKTTVTINDECSFDCRNYTARFFGKVRADKPTCERRRKVILLRKGKPGEGFQKIGDTKSDASGNWEMIRIDKPGFTDYMVKVKEVRKAKLRCLAATSDKESHDSFARAHNRSSSRRSPSRRGRLAITRASVISDSGDCMKNRRVTLIAKEQGTDAEFVIGHARTDKKGRWNYQVIGEGYYATVKEKVIKRGDHKHTCLFDRSPTTPFRR